MAYTARVEPVEGDPAESTPWVVIPHLRFSYMCGSHCALGFQHDRRVYMDASGVPVRVEGDRAPQWMVS
jgi:hypothetical protein